MYANHDFTLAARDNLEVKTSAKLPRYAIALCSIYSILELLDTIHLFTVLLLYATSTSDSFHLGQQQSPLPPMICHSVPSHSRVVSPSSILSYGMSFTLFTLSPPALPPLELPAIGPEARPSPSGSTGSLQ